MTDNSHKIDEIYKILYKNYDYNSNYMDRVLKCKDTDYIPKVDNAGDVIWKDDAKCQVMHNGALIHEGCYHQAWMTDIIRALRGHHEPQEEKLFHAVLQYLDENAVMVECGSFWSYYSLWFNKEISNARNIMIEPMPLKCAIGKLNFELNNAHGEFLEGYIGNEYKEASIFTDWDGEQYKSQSITVDSLFDNYDINSIDVLHADIQENEMVLLEGASRTLKNKRINYLFLVTHSKNKPFIKKLKNYGYHILASFEIHQSYFDDGLVLACSPKVFHKLDKSKFIISKKRSISGWFYMMFKDAKKKIRKLLSLRV